jgi:predicted ferric reductase
VTTRATGGTRSGPAPTEQVRARPELAPTSLLLGVAAGAVVAVGLWFTGTPQNLHGPADWLTNAGRITGLLGGYGCVVLVLLMARIPAVERGVGTDRLARWHSMGGRYVVSLLVAHSLLIVLGYAQTTGVSVVTQAHTLLFGYADVMMATVAMGLFLGVGVVSMRAIRPRLRYETWYYLHFYTYLALALSFAHAFANGAQFLNSPLNRVYWTALYAVAATMLVWFRLVVPVRQNLRHRMRVAQVVQEGPGVISLLVTGEHLEELGAEAGHFFRWRFLTRDDWWQSHPYSLSAPPHPQLLRVTVKDLGDHSAGVGRIPVGTRVVAEGPYGAMTQARRTRRKVLLVAGGVGITPLRALFESLPGRAGDIELLYRVGSEADIVLRGELDAIARSRRRVIHYLAGPRGSASDPFVGGRLAQLVPDVRHRDVYVCGPPGMTEVAIAALRGAGVPDQHIHTEGFEL